MLDCNGRQYFLLGWAKQDTGLRHSESENKSMKHHPGFISLGMSGMPCRNHPDLASAHCNGYPILWAATFSHPPYLRHIKAQCCIPLGGHFPHTVTLPSGRGPRLSPTREQSVRLFSLTNKATWAKSLSHSLSITSKPNTWVFWHSLFFPILPVGQLCGSRID